MVVMDNAQCLAILHTLLAQAGHPHGWETLTLLAGDGSDRPFFRLALSGQSYLAAFPSPTMDRAKAEANATYLIGKHLWQCGVPVPEILAHDPASGAILFEDLGDRLLFHEVKAAGEERVVALYRQAVTLLADLQLGAREGFRAEWCWDTPRYDRELMINRESNYFAREFCGRLMGMPTLPPGLPAEFAALADRISLCPASSLMHRDYQSRNLMVVGDRLRVIDFQGARFGPLAYDLASLLNDPYVAISPAAKEGLLALYLERANTYISLDPVAFMGEYYPIALQRNLQVLGAYAFLTLVRGKEFFRAYIDPALQRLSTLLASNLAADYPVLLDLVTQIAASRREEHTPSCQKN
jgi:hypothetical protein